MRGPVLKQRGRAAPEKKGGIPGKRSSMCRDLAGERGAWPAAKDYCAAEEMQSSVLRMRRGLTGQ